MNKIFEGLKSCVVEYFSSLEEEKYLSEEENLIDREVDQGEHARKGKSSLSETGYPSGKKNLIDRNVSPFSGVGEASILAYCPGRFESSVVYEVFKSIQLRHWIIGKCTNLKGVLGLLSTNKFYRSLLSDDYLPFFLWKINPGISFTYLSDAKSSLKDHKERFAVKIRNDKQLIDFRKGLEELKKCAAKDKDYLNRIVDLSLCSVTSRDPQLDRVLELLKKNLKSLSCGVIWGAFTVKDFPDLYSLSCDDVGGPYTGGDVGVGLKLKRLPNLHSFSCGITYKPLRLKDLPNLHSFSRGILATELPTLDNFSKAYDQKLVVRIETTEELESFVQRLKEPEAKDYLNQIVGLSLSDIENVNRVNEALELLKENLESFTCQRIVSKGLMLEGLPKLRSFCCFDIFCALKLKNLPKLHSFSCANIKATLELEDLPQLYSFWCMTISVTFTLEGLPNLHSVSCWEACEDVILKRLPNLYICSYKKSKRFIFEGVPACIFYCSEK